MDSRKIAVPNTDNSGDWFLQSFYKKSANTIILRMIEDIAQEKHLTQTQTKIIKDMAYLTLLTLQGSIVTSGTAFGVTELLKYCGYNENNAYIIGYAVGIAVSLTLDTTPMGITKTLITTTGGTIGKVCAKWASNGFAI